MCNSLLSQLFCQALAWVTLILLLIFLVSFIHHTIFHENILKLIFSNRLCDIWNKLFNGGLLKSFWALEIILLSLVPLIFALSGTKIDSEVLNIITKDLNFAAISIALATYIATIRLYLIGRLGQNPNSPQLIKATIVTMIPADFNLILSAVFIVMKYFIRSFPPDCFVNFSAVAFLYAVIYLAFQHLIAWIISFYKLIGYD